MRQPFDQSRIFRALYSLSHKLWHNSSKKKVFGSWTWVFDEAQALPKLVSKFHIPYSTFQTSTFPNPRLQRRKYKDQRSTIKINDQRPTIKDQRPKTKDQSPAFFVAAYSTA